MMEKLIAVASDGEKKIWKGHFGISPFFMIFDLNGKQIELRKNPYSAENGKHKHHDDPKRIVSLLHDCSVFIAKRMGDKSKRNLVEKMNITPVITEETTPSDAVAKYLGKMKEAR